MNKKLLTIFNTYGKSHQTSKLLEEIGEFIETIMNDDKENMVKELADVMVLLNQFKLYYCIYDEEVKRVMIEKINRQMERIENEEQRKLT